MNICKTCEGKWIRLQGISGHGKNRIHEHGDIWLVEHVGESKVRLRSHKKTFKIGDEMHHDGRWIVQGVDKNFKVVGIDVMEKNNDV